VLGGIRSGKSEFAESLVATASRVRYVATAAGHGHDDPEWAARLDDHRLRRPDAWATEETGADPARLAEVIAGAHPDETLLVDDLGGWVTVLLDPTHQPADDTATIAELAAAVRACAARLVLVSPEVGLSLVPATPVGRAFADALGSTNQAIAAACDSVVLVVAGQPTWLKPAEPTVASPAIPAQPAPARPALLNLEPDGADVAGDEGARPAESWTAPTVALPIVPTGLAIQPGMELPLPDDLAPEAAVERLAGLDLPGAGLGQLQRVVEFAAGTQGSAAPTPWRLVRVLLLHGDHHGGCAAGDEIGWSAHRARQARRGEGALAQLAADAGASLQVIEAPAADPIEDGPALTSAAVDAALRYGWQLADEAVDGGADVLVIAACGAGTDAAAAAVLAATTGAEPAAVLARVVAAGGHVDDAAWMRRCAAVRDALRRTRQSDRSAPAVLANLGGGDIAVATGLLLGATARRTPVLLDGPIGVAAALVSRELAGQARHWCLLPDHGGHPGVRRAADVLGLTPLVDLRLGLGEGATSLATLPLLRSALALAAALPAHPGHGGSAVPQPGPDADDNRGSGDDRPGAADQETAEPEVGQPRFAESGFAESRFAEPEPAEREHTSAEPEPEPERESEPEREPEPAVAEPAFTKPEVAEPEFVEPEPEGPGPTSAEEPTAGELHRAEPGRRSVAPGSASGGGSRFLPVDAPRGG
jgi:nicotinate-nucleotide--dimethylbenzimidazole phosphoribosyltransferase